MNVELASDGQPVYDPDDNALSFSRGYHSYGDPDDLGSVGELVDAHQWEHSESSFGGLY